MPSTQDLLRLAYKTADKYSPDPSTKVGAIIVRQDGTMHYGWNHLPAGFEHIDLLDRELKLKLMEHAERDAIYKTALYGGSLFGAVMFCPWAACCDCARAITLSGIKEVVCHGEAIDQTPLRWQPDIVLAQEIFQKNDVKYTKWYGKVGECQNLFSGTYWYP